MGAPVSRGMTAPNVVPDPLLETRDGVLTSRETRTANHGTRYRRWRIDHNRRTGKSLKGNPGSRRRLGAGAVVAAGSGGPRGAPRTTAGDQRWSAGCQWSA